jgi:flagellar assembly factor FliW
VAVLSSEKLGIMVISENQKAEDFLDKIIVLNPNSCKLDHQFTMPDETKLEYDVNSPKNLWVIRATNGKPIDRNYDLWPLIQGDFLKTN